MHVWNVLHAARWKVQDAKKSPFWHHRTPLSGCIFAAKVCIDNRKKLLNSDTSSTCPHNMVNFGLLTAQICWRVCGTPANFNGFRVLAALLHCTPAVGVSQTLQRWTEGAMAPIFGKAAITLGIGPHSSCNYLAPLQRTWLPGVLWRQSASKWF